MTKSELIEAGMHKAVPEGVRWGGLTPENDPSQLLIDWPGHRSDDVQCLVARRADLQRPARPPDRRWPRAWLART